MASKPRVSSSVVVSAFGPTPTRTSAVAASGAAPPTPLVSVVQATWRTNVPCPIGEMSPGSCACFGASGFSWAASMPQYELPPLMPESTT